MTEQESKRRPLSMEARTSLLELVSIALVAGGIAAIYWPAALIFAGLAGLAVSFVQTRTAEGSTA